MSDGADVAWIVLANVSPTQTCSATMLRLTHASKSIAARCTHTGVVSRFARVWESERAKHAVVSILERTEGVVVYARVGDIYPAPWIVLDHSENESTVTVWNALWAVDAVPIVCNTAHRRTYTTAKHAVDDFATLAQGRRLRKVTAMSHRADVYIRHRTLQRTVTRLFPPVDICEFLENDIPHNASSHRGPDRHSDRAPCAELAAHLLQIPPAGPRAPGGAPGGGRGAATSGTEL